MGKSRREIAYRVQFAERFPTEKELCNAIAQWHSWYEIVSRALRSKRSSGKAPSFPKTKFGVILADPPWEYDFVKSESRAVANQYPTMSVEAIKRLRDSSGASVADLAGKDCALFLWATNPKLREALEVVEAWEGRTNWFPHAAPRESFPASCRPQARTSRAFGLSPIV